MSASFVSPEEQLVASISASLVRVPVSIKSSNVHLDDLDRTLAPL
ncbi:hypothetical protein [Natrinema sp. SYSU A 869]|nr:hypothetical protein [Natrinema sp. SYSU A 869]